MFLRMAIGEYTSFFTPTIFTRRVVMGSSPYIKAMHPKTEIKPEPQAIQRILNAGWVAQTKIHGHRAQIHVPSDPEQSVIAYTRQAKLHKKVLPPKMVKEILRLFKPAKGWNVIDAEWLKEEDKLFVFDFLKREGETLRLKNFPARFALLPRAFISPCISVLPILRDLPSCLKIMETTDDHIEGLVFKSTTSMGFSDTSIVRCRKRK